MYLPAAQMEFMKINPSFLARLSSFTHAQASGGLLFLLAQPNPDMITINGASLVFRTLSNSELKAPTDPRPQFMDCSQEITSTSSPAKASPHMLWG